MGRSPLPAAAFQGYDEAMNEKWTAWLGLAVAVVIAYMSIDLLLPRRSADTEATDE